MSAPFNINRISPNLSWAFNKAYYFHWNSEQDKQFFITYFEKIEKEVKENEKKIKQNNANDQNRNQDNREALKNEIAKLKKEKDDFFVNKNKELTSFQLDPFKSVIKLFSIDLPLAPEGQPSLTIEAPGFVTGTGIKRGTGELGEIKIGFAFDYTTGLPFLPGSSVKGLLRSAFPQRYNTQLQEQSPDFTYNRVCFLQAYFESHKINLQTSVTTWLGKLGNIDMPLITYELAIDILEMSIFSSMIPQNFGVDNLPVFKTKSSAARDIFFDAYLDVSVNDKAFLATDFITPHLNRKKPELSPFTEPDPLEFIKVRPGVAFRFQWLLKDDILTATEKQTLFTHILKTFGIGAKTNVGYGQLT